MRSLWLDILGYARWAPSPHNMQSWRFRFERDDSVTLLYDPDRLLPNTDPAGRFCAVGFGILIETMSIAAAPLGYDVAVQFHTEFLDPRAGKLTPFARLTLVNRDKIELLDRQLILDRRTSRLPYDDKPVPTHVLEELRDVAAEYGHVFEWSVDRKEVAWVVRLNADTMFFDMSDPVSRNEVGGWIRFSMREAKQRADGLAAYAMHFAGPLMWLFVHHNWLFRLPGVYQMVRAFYVRSMRGTRTAAWLSGPFDKHDDWIRAGRMMARMWLVMTKHDVYLHPFGSVITNPKAHALMAEHFENPARKDDLWMLVRLGQSELPPQAQRITLDELIVK